MATSDRLHVLGIRHHGPGSARRVERALEALTPATVLIEGPADATDLLPLLADPACVPPVAVLCFAEGEPERAGFWPFARFSPEYRAALWAARVAVPAAFIDLPSTARWDDEEEETADASALIRDPIGRLAAAAGYDDGEDWWSDTFERLGEDDPLAAFAAVTDAMAALRETEGPEDPARARREARREAHMRRAISDALKATEGPVAVICGAWHAPALTARTSAKEDRATLKGMKRAKAQATLAPWTAPRLAAGSGYGAGVRAPGWYAHLWDMAGREAAGPTWLARTARALREAGHDASTASLIEAERLARTLAALRARPAAGFEEMRDATVSVLCGGEPARLTALDADLLIGTGVGEIPEGVPLAPLLDDLKRQQRATRLKPEAMARELALDLRSASGLARSTLLHRLLVLDVPWGRPLDPGRSRGTFRERWQLEWRPELAVALVENLVHGPTIARAADTALAIRARDADTLGTAADIVARAIEADLPRAVAAGLATLESRAATGSDALDTLRALPPLADAARYGEARQTQATAALPDLLERLATRAAVALPLATRDLDADAATEMAQAVASADGALRLIAPPEAVAEAWSNALREVANAARSAPRVAGKAAALLYEAGTMAPEAAATLLARHLTPGTATEAAAGFLEGFLTGIADRLIHDAPLRTALDAWLMALDEEAFTAALPLLRRVFSGLDAMERRRVADAATGAARTGRSVSFVPPEAEALFHAHLTDLAALFAGTPLPETAP